MSIINGSYVYYKDEWVSYKTDSYELHIQKISQSDYNTVMRINRDRYQEHFVISWQILSAPDAIDPRMRIIKCNDLNIEICEYELRNHPEKYDLYNKEKYLHMLALYGEIIYEKLR